MFFLHALFPFREDCLCCAGALVTSDMMDRLAISLAIANINWSETVGIFVDVNGPSAGRIQCGGPSVLLAVSTKGCSSKAS